MADPTFFERLQAARAQEQQQNRAFWNNLFPASSPAVEDWQAQFLARKAVKDMGQQIPATPVSASMEDQAVPFNVPFQAAGNPVLDSLAQGEIPPPIRKGPISEEFARRQLAMKGGDDLEAFPSNARLPRKAVTKLQTQYDKQIDSYMKEREKLIKNQQERAKILREAEQKVDLSPLLALVDSETGSQFARSYQKPTSQFQREALATKLEQQASAGIGSLANLQAQMRNQEILQDKWKRDNMLREKLGKMRTGQEKPLSGEQLKRLDYVVGAEDALTRLKAAVNAGETMRPDIPLVGDNDFTMALRDAAENYGRMQSGGAINKDEEKRFLAKVYKMGDSRENVLKKIKVFEQEMEGRRTRLMSGGRDLGRSTGKPDPGVTKPKYSNEDEQLFNRLGIGR